MSCAAMNLLSKDVAEKIKVMKRGGGAYGLEY